MINDNYNITIFNNIQLMDMQIEPTKHNTFFNDALFASDIFIQYDLMIQLKVIS
jgi:hypothetical protein